MLIEQIFKLRGPGPPGRVCAPITGCFHDKTIISKENIRLYCYLPEVESSRTFLASRTSSRTHFEVLGLGLETSSPYLGLEALGPRKLSCPRLEKFCRKTLEEFFEPRLEEFFEPLKFCRKTPETSRKTCKYLFCFPQLEHRLSQAGLLSQLKFHQ